MISHTMTDEQVNKIEKDMYEMFTNLMLGPTNRQYIDIIERALNKAGYVITEADDGK